MIYTLEQLTCMVRTALGRHIASRPLLPSHDPDVIELDWLIRSKVEAVARAVYASASIELLADTARDLSEEGIYWHPETDGLLSGHILLPRDYLRLRVFEMSDWQQAVTQTASSDTAQYAAQSSPYGGVRGTPYRPVCIVSESAEGRLLTFHSCLSDQATVVQAQYIPLPTIDHYGGIDISPTCIDIVIDETVSRVRATQLKPKE